MELSSIILAAREQKPHLPSYRRRLMSMTSWEQFCSMLIIPQLGPWQWYPFHRILLQTAITSYPGLIRLCDQLRL